MTQFGKRDNFQTNQYIPKMMVDFIVVVVVVSKTEHLEDLP